AMKGQPARLMGTRTVFSMSGTAWPLMLHRDRAGNGAQPNMVNYCGNATFPAHGKVRARLLLPLLKPPVLTMWLQRFRKRCSVTGLRITRLAETAFPLELNSLSIGEDGELHRTDPRTRPFGFTFEC